MAVGKMSLPFPLRWDMDLVPCKVHHLWNPGSLIQQQQQQHPTKHLPRNSTSNLLFLNESDIVAGIDGITFILYLPQFFFSKSSVAPKNPIFGAPVWNRPFSWTVPIVISENCLCSNGGVSFVNYQTSSKQNRMAALMCFGKNNDKEAASADFLLLFQQLSCQKKIWWPLSWVSKNLQPTLPKKKNTSISGKNKAFLLSAS